VIIQVDRKLDGAGRKAVVAHQGTILLKAAGFDWGKTIKKPASELAGRKE
jgi:hypothetical protein